MNWQLYGKAGDLSGFDAIVIGSGIGGLALAALLAKEGRKVLVLEQHYVPGGFTHTFERKGYEWDVGVHYVGDVHREGTLLSRLFDHLTGGELRWAPMGDPYDRVFFPDRSYDFVSGSEAFAQKMIEAFPDGEKAVRGYLKAVREAAGAARGYYALKAMPPAMALVAAPFLGRKFLSYSDRTTAEVLSGLTKDKKLSSVLAAQWGDYGLPPSRSSFAVQAMVARHYLNGGAYPVGGSARFAATLVPVIEKAGGRVLVKARVDSVLARGGRAVGVRMADGGEIEAPVVASDAGAVNTFGKLVPAAERARFKLDEKLSHVKQSLAHVCLYVGCKAASAELKLPRANFWIYPDYDYERAIDAYLADPKSELPVAYISFPSAKDPDFARRHPGHATVEVIGFAPYEWFAKWENTAWHRRGADYEELKARFSERLLAKLYEYVPALKGKVDYHELSTPLSTRHFCAYDRGEIYGLDHTPQRFRQKWLAPRTPLKGLYLTGQDVVSDGIAGALFGGVLCASVISGKNPLKDILG